MEAMGCFAEGDGGAGDVPVEEGVLRCGEPPPHSDIKERTVDGISECLVKVAAGRQRMVAGNKGTIYLSLGEP